MIDFIEIKKIVSVPRKLSKGELDIVSGVIYSYLRDPKFSIQLFGLWHRFFTERKFDIAFVTELFDTFWEWYVVATFENFSKHSAEEMVSIMVYQTPMAFRLGYDVPLLYIDYQMLYVPEEQDQRNLHKAIGEGILGNTMPFDYRRGISLKDLIQKIKQKDRLDRIEWSNMMGAMEEFVFPENVTASLTLSMEEKLDKVVKIFDFFVLLSDVRAIDGVRETYVRYAPHLSSSLFSDITFDEFSKDELEKAEQIIEQEGVVQDQDVPKNNLSTTRDAIVRSAEDQKLSIGSDEYVDFVLNALQKYSEQYNDPRILDLYYYDEKTGSFVWNEELLDQE